MSEKFEAVRRKPGRGGSPRDKGVILKSEVTPDGARYLVAWDRNPLLSAWHHASELEWIDE